jgi:hypothetical protein
MANLVYPTSAELMAIAQDLIPRLQADRPIFDIMPVRDVDEYTLIWEQQDNFSGLQQVRGLNGEPGRVKRVGVNRFEVEPGVYGEFLRIDERELTRRRQMGTYGSPIDISDLVLEAQNQLLVRRLDRIEQIGWSLLGNGTYSVPGPNGVTLATDSFTLQNFTAANGWTSEAEATPLADFRSVKILARGHSVSFGAQARAYMNQSTFNQLISNTNPADLYGRRQAGLGLINNLDDMNRLLAGDDLPQICVYDEGYLDDNADFQLFLPTGTAVVIGKRPAGQRVAEYRMTRNANNIDLAPGPYMRVIDEGEFKIPRNVDVHDGHNGGPVVFYGSAVVVMTVN